MGLDIYLSASKYVGDWDHNEITECDQYKAIAKAVGLDGFRCEGSPTLNVDIKVAYWRKANQIHAWFVKHVQGGSDECRPFEVSREQLSELVALCKKVLETKDPTPLPPASGFFFGSTEINDWYWEDLKATVQQLEPLLTDPRFEDWSFEYRSSW